VVSFNHDNSNGARCTHFSKESRFEDFHDDELIGKWLIGMGWCPIRGGVRLCFLS
jgi:hypothetical protein